MRDVLLASSSVFRKTLLERLNFPFSCFAPDIDETPLEHELPDAHVIRLSCEKARKAAQTHPKPIIIGSDEIAVCQGEILGKPMTHDNAVKQLQKLSGQEIIFYTGLCVYDPISNTTLSDCVCTYTQFLELNQKEIEQYLQKEKPYYSAGAFKSETSGAALLAYSKSDDPTAIIGLPLIRVCQFLKELGFNILGS